MHPPKQTQASSLPCRVQGYSKAETSLVSTARWGAGVFADTSGGSFERDSTRAQQHA